MKASFTLDSATDKATKILAFIPALIWIFYPAFAQADTSLQNSGERALVFEVKNTASLNSSSAIQNTANTDQTNTKPQATLMTYEQLAQATQPVEPPYNPLERNLKAYLEKHNSPMAVYAGEIIKLPQWQRALAVSYQEGHYGRFCANNNCSGIGGSPKSKSWRKYPTKLDWFKDMTNLMEKPMYKLRFNNCHTMNGVYNQPGSKAWLNSCIQRSRELVELTHRSEQERLALIKNPSQVTAATAELSLQK